MSNQRKPGDKGNEKREKEFCGYWGGANRELASNIRRSDKSQGRSQSKGSRKQWEIENKPENLRKSNEEEERNISEEAPVKRERRGWGVPRPNQPETRQSKDEDIRKPKSPERELQEEIPDYSDKSEERGTKENIGSKDEISKEEEENEEIRNFISSMKNMDIQKLRQSMKEDELKKSVQEAQGIKTSTEKPKLKEKTGSDDIEEDITEDIGDDDIEEQESINKSKVEQPSYYGGKYISVRKPRPISATYGHLSSSKPADQIFSGIPSNKEKVYESKNQYDTRSSITHLSGIPSKTEYNPKSAQKANCEEEQGLKGVDSLLKRIESLDESKKQLLENILDKIEKGNLSKDYLLGLEFLHIKKNAKENKNISKHEESKRPDNRKDKASTKQELSLPSSVESKISKITQSTSSRGREEHSRKKENTVEDFMSPIKEEEMIVEKHTPQKDDEIKEIISEDAYQDSLDEKQYTSKIRNEKKHHSNVEKIHVPETLKIQQQPNPKKETIPERGLKLEDNKLLNSDEHQIQFRIMSTWGSVSNAGLTEIQIFDETGNKIDLKPSAFHLRNCGLTSIKNIGRIVNGVIYTIEEDHMWVCAMPAPPTTPEITITVKSEKGIGGFRIWNYNKSLIESIKGIKELEIIHNRTIVWFGIINRGPGNEFEAYHTEAILKKGLVLPPVEAPVTNQGLEADQFEGETKRKISGDKYEIGNDKSSSVPIWLQDTQPRESFPLTTNLESQSSRANLSRRDYEKSAPALNIEKFKPDIAKPGPDRAQTQSQELKLEAFGAKNQPKSESQDRGRLGESERPSESRNQARIKNHPKTNSPFKDILDEKDFFKKSDEKTPKGIQVSAQKENLHSAKKDDNSSINSVEFFNITNFGRLKPAKRESLIQVLDLKQDVMEKIKDVQKRLDFRASPIKEEGDILSQFDKGLKEESAKLKLPAQKAVGTNISTTAQKEEIIASKKILPPQSKGQSDSLDSMITKAPSSVKAAGVEMPVGKGIYEGKSFRIPELPRGRVIKFSIYSTWGDAYYIGLNGIELFNEKGESIILQDVLSQIRADPSDINCLPGYGKDPRTVDKLVDGTYLTCDDLHVWLAPFTQGKEHTIEIDFREKTTISMIRIWNYNKSRIHSYRGARDIAIKLDDTPIFFGEISKAPGSLKGAEDSCEYILFTENDNILSKIDRNDWLNVVPKNDPTGLNATVERPMTGTKQFDEHELRQIKDVLARPSAAGGRPLTMAKVGNENKIKEQIEKNKRELKRLEEQEKNRQENEKANVNKALSIISSSNSTYAEMKCKNIVITITKSWGDSFYVGLTGLEIYDGEGNKVPIQMKNLNAKPRDMNSIPGYSGDTRTLDKLINNVNVTAKDENMWLIPYTPNQNHCIYINFDEARTISGIRVWNYNKNEEGSYRGSKTVTISADGVLITPPSGVLLKKAPGTDYYDFSQFIPLPFFEGWDDQTVKLYKSLQPKPMEGFLIQEYDTPEFPTGFLFKIKLLTTWGDYNYIGLNGIEFYDQFGEGMLSWGQKDFKIAAEPSSVSCLPGHEGDIRTVDKLISGDNETFDDRNMWLAPYLLERRDEGVYKADHNEIIISFDKPRIISCIKFWNYSKTPERGVREIEIFCDDSVLYRGYLKKASSESESKTNMAISTSVLFTKDKNLITKLEPEIYTENGIPQKVILNNEKKVVNPSENRPQTQVTLERPTTSVKGLMNY